MHCTGVTAYKDGIGPAQAIAKRRAQRGHRSRGYGELWRPQATMADDASVA